MEPAPLRLRLRSRPVSIYGSPYSAEKLARMGVTTDTFRRGSLGDIPRPLPVSRHDSAEVISKGPVYLWDGRSQVKETWDSLRKDLTLFDSEAACGVHFYARGRSQRGPSLRVPVEAVERSGCLALLASYSQRTAAMSSDLDSRYSNVSAGHVSVDLYIPPPLHVFGADALAWHITSRNLFAWIMGEPLVGASLGQALIDLLERLLVTRTATEDNVGDVIAYAERQGYLDLTNNPDYALAMLAFAEHAHEDSLRTDAFVHCVGMTAELSESSEYDSISPETRAAIAKSYHDMTVRLCTANRAISNFVEADLSAACLGLTSPQRAHLDRFRSFLCAFYVNKLGYWPPPFFSRQLLSTMRDEFECLYGLLVRDATSSMPESITSGGLCVLQNITAFDRRHGYTQLSSALPLSPKSGHVFGKALHSSGLSGLLKSRSNRRALLFSARRDLLEATNQGALLECGLVQAYLGFEHDSLLTLEPALTVSDARNVRWIQIYFTLQVLRSVTDSPASATGLTDAAYHTCCEVPGYVRPSKALYSSLLIHPAHRSPEKSRPSSASGSDPDVFSIHPDCELDNYFAPKPVYPRARCSSMIIPGTTMMPPRTNTAPLLSRATSMLARRTSLRTTASVRRLRRPSQTRNVISTNPERLYPASSQATSFELPTEDEETSADEFGSGTRTPVFDLSALEGLDSSRPLVCELEAISTLTQQRFDFCLPTHPISAVALCASDDDDMSGPHLQQPPSRRGPATDLVLNRLTRSSSSGSSGADSVASSASASGSEYSSAPSSMSASSDVTILHSPKTPQDTVFATIPDVGPLPGMPRVADWASAYDECLVAPLSARDDLNMYKPMGVLENIQESAGERPMGMCKFTAEDRPEESDDEQWERRGRGIERKLTVHHYRSHVAALLSGRQ